MRIVHYGLLEDILLPDGENLAYVPGASRPRAQELDWMQEMGDGSMNSEITTDEKLPDVVAKNMEDLSRRYRVH